MTPPGLLRGDVPLGSAIENAPQSRRKPNSVRLGLAVGDARASTTTGLGVTTMAEAVRLDLHDVAVLGLGTDRNVRLTMTPKGR